MNKTIDDFSKSLAGGMSRRGAFLKLLGGAGVLGFLGVQKAKASEFPKNKALCSSYCLNLADEEYLFCMLCNPKDQNECFEQQNIDYLKCAYECANSK
ncbi:MAG TPA: hypothetical protein VG096_15045 [Bryobacteraceae bacterium]|jgi:hypothetical protein|nr:hypothetical protein [Bryobacteraceae bacterium]